MCEGSERAYLDERFSRRELTSSEKVQNHCPVQSLRCFGGGEQWIKSWQRIGEFLCGMESTIADGSEDVRGTYFVQRLAVARDGVINLLLPFI